jgi:RNA polymerase sigma-70 factor (ECF subfamily)
VTSDEELLATFTAGGPGASTAFDELLTRHSRRVYAICYRYFGDAADAEDATQDTFIALLRRASTFRGQAAFSTWLYRVATNACNDLARRRARRPHTSGDVALVADVADPSDALATAELQADLHHALDQLDPVSRAAIVLHDVEGVPYADVADRLGLPVGTVKSRIHRGHVRLVDLLAPSQDRTHVTPRADATAWADTTSNDQP